MKGRIMTREMKWGIAAVLGIIIVFGGVMLYNRNQEQKLIVKEVDRNLTQEDRGIYETRLAEIDQKISQAQSDEERFNLYMQKGHNLYGLGKLAEAVEWYVKAADIKSSDTAPFVALHQVKMEMNDNRGAREAIKKAISLESSNPDFWKRYILMEKERFGASNEVLQNLYNEALEKTAAAGNNVDMVTVYAQFLESIGNFQGAKEQWQKAIELNPANKAAYEAEIKRIDALIKQLP